jgi:phosphoribosylpyrophosphate synthetase
LPLIYQSRQNAIKENESRDYHLFIEELKNLNVDKIISFELHGDDEFVNSYSLASLFASSNYDVVVSPDAGGVNRASKYAQVLNCENTGFSKVRNLSVLTNGSNPIEEYKASEYNFDNKKVLIVDDILDSGKTLINAIKKIDNANKIDVFVAYPLFTSGIKEFSRLVKSGKLNKLYISNLIHIDKKVLKHKFIEVINTDELVSKIIREVQ